MAIAVGLSYSVMVSPIFVSATTLMFAMRYPTSPAERRSTSFIFRIHSDDGMQLFEGARDIRSGQIDLIDDGQDLQMMIQSEVRIRQSLRLHSLRSIDDEKRSLTGCKAS